MVPLVMPDSILKSVDVIVITAITYIQEIRDILDDHIDCPMVSIKEILDTMMLDAM